MSKTNHTRTPITIASGKSYQDASDTPKKSPLAVSSSEIAIKVPDDAIAFVYQARDADMKIASISGFGSGYVVILSGNGDTDECADGGYIYVKRDASVDVELHFYFKTI